MTRIAVIGAGNIGGTLGDAWVRAGHEVTFGVRDPAKRDDGRRYAAPEAAVDSAEVVVLAVPGAAVENTVRSLGRALDGRIVIDASNRLNAPKTHSEALQSMASDGVHVFRAFNSLGWENFANPRFADEVADLLYAGPDDSTRPTVESLIEDVGLRPIYVGPDPDVVDGALRLWFSLARRYGRHLAFRILKD